MADFNTTDVHNLLSGYSASDFTSFKNDVINNGFISAWTSRVNVPGFWQTSMGSMTSYHTTHFADSLKCTGNAMGDPVCQGLDVTVSIQDNNGGTAGKIWVEISCDLHLTVGGWRTSISISIVNKP